MTSRKLFPRHNRADELKAIVTECTRSAWTPVRQTPQHIEQEGTYVILPEAEVILAVDGCCEMEIQVFLF